MPRALTQRPWTVKPPLGVPLNSAHPLGSGLYLAYGLQEGSGNTVHDLSAANNIGTLQGTLTGIWVPGMSGGPAYQGIVANTTLLTSRTQFSTAPTTFSYSFWFTAASGSGAPIVNYENNQTGTGSTSYDRGCYIGSDDTLYFNIFVAADVVIHSTATVSDSKWHHGVAVANGTGIWLYLDGVLAASNVSAGTAVNYSGYFRVGGYKNSGHTAGSDGYFGGKIDQAFVYNRALTAAEVQQLYLNPYGMYLPARGIPIAFASSVVTTALTLADALVFIDLMSVSSAFGPAEGALTPLDGATTQGQPTITDLLGSVEARTAALSASLPETPAAGEALATAGTSGVQDAAGSAESTATSSALTLLDTGVTTETVAYSLTSVLTLIDTLTALDTLLTTLAAGTAENATTLDTLVTNTASTDVDRLSTGEAAISSAASTLAEATGPQDTLTGTTTTTLGETESSAETFLASANATLLTLLDTLTSLEGMSTSLASTLLDALTGADQGAAAQALTLTDGARTGETLTSLVTALLALSDQLASAERAGSTGSLTGTEAANAGEQLAAGMALGVADALAALETFQTNIATTLLTLIDALAAGEQIVTLTMSSEREAWQLAEVFARALLPVLPTITVTVETTPTITVTVARVS